jgi:hypothetical protein
MIQIYLLHGLRVRSDVPLAAPLADGGPFELEICLGERRLIPDHPPEGRLLAHVELPVGSSSLVGRTDGYLLRIHSLCEFEIDPLVRSIVVHLVPDADDDVARLFAAGALSTALTLQRYCVLHASAVESAGRVVAFIGAAGMGKTTAAALCCTAGARLVADDALRVEYEQQQGWCFLGLLELRLRAGADMLAASFGTSSRTSSVDQRVCVRPPPATSLRLPLGAIVTPICERESDELRVERLHAADAALELLRYPRSVGWIDLEPGRQQFRVLTALASAVPVYRAMIPWGLPFHPDLGSKLLTEIGSWAPTIR